MELIRSYILNPNADHDATVQLYESPNVSDVVGIKYQPDVLILGAGPGGLSAAHKLTLRGKSVRILEKSEHTLAEYKDSNYDDTRLWQNAMGDARFSESFASSDGDTVWKGSGNGGGTLHFGLQYIDTESLIQSSELDPAIFAELQSLTQPQRYDYTHPAFNPNLANLRTSLEESSDFTTHNNKVYCTNLETHSRLLYGDVYSSNVTHGVHIDKLTMDNQAVRYARDSQGKRHYAGSYVLAGGAITNPHILQNSGIATPDTSMYDHLGFTVVYGKLVQQPVYSQVYDPDHLVTLNIDTLQKIHNTTGRYVYKAEGTNIPAVDTNKVWDFTNFTTQHIGGTAKITQWTSTQTLVYPPTHSSLRWNSNKGKFPLIGDFEGSIRWGSLPNELQTDALAQSLGVPVISTGEIQGYEYIPQDLGLDNDNIVGHLQTRAADLSWQTYYSLSPGQSTALVLTHAQSAVLNKTGSVAGVDVDFNRATGDLDVAASQLLDAYSANENILTGLGYTRLSPSPGLVSTINAAFVKTAMNSIYHYHGSCSSLVDGENKVNGVSNLYIGDASALKKPWGGSTSVPAAVQGLIAGSYASTSSSM